MSNSRLIGGAFIGGAEGLKLGGKVPRDPCDSRYDQLARVIRPYVVSLARQGDTFRFVLRVSGTEAALYAAVNLVVRVWSGARFMSGSPSHLRVSIPSDPPATRRGCHHYA